MAAIEPIKNESFSDGLRVTQWNHGPQMHARALDQTGGRARSCYCQFELSKAARPLAF